MVHAVDGDNGKLAVPLIPPILARHRFDYRVEAYSRPPGSVSFSLAGLLD